MNCFESIGVIKNDLLYNNKLLSSFEDEIMRMKNKKEWTKSQIVKLFLTMLPDFNHKETGKYLDSKM